MKIVNKQPEKTADISSARGTSAREFWKLVLSAVALMVALYFLIGFAVDLVVARVSYETEAKIFRAIQIDRLKPPGDANQEKLTKVRRILDKFKANPSVPPLPYELVLIDEAAPNAFAFPGGTIGITDGLLEMLGEEIEIAFVIGHELGHFHNRDHLQGLGRAAGLSIVMAVLFDAGAGAESLATIVDFVYLRNYSQTREIAADRFGLTLVRETYGKTEGTDKLFRQLMETAQLPSWAYMFATHASPRQRIAILEEEARKAGQP